MLVAGLDLERRSDHSALVLLDGEPDRLTVTAALRLPQAPLSQQFALIARTSAASISFSSIKAASATPPRNCRRRQHRTSASASSPAIAHSRARRTETVWSSAVRGGALTSQPAQTACKSACGSV